MDTVVKSMLEEEEEERKGFTIFGRDVSQIPCFRESFVNGIGSGILVGLAAFIKTSRPLYSQHIGMAAFSITTLGYWSYCRYMWSQSRFNAQLLKQALQDKILQEGVEQELENKGVLKSA